MIYDKQNKQRDARYSCDVCGKEQSRQDMRGEYCFGYDQLCCTGCGDVLIDDLHGTVHCTKIH